MTVTEKLPQPGELYRVDLELGRGVRAARLYAMEAGRCFTRDGNLSRPGEWRLEARFPDAPQEGELEKVRVPAGEFACVRVERCAADGKVVAEEWYARGAGLVRSRSLESGAVSVLLAYLPPSTG
jgi:hypothetical protein